MSKQLTIFVVVSLIVHFWVAYLLQEHFGRPALLEQPSLAFRLIAHATAKATSRQVHQPVVRTKAPQTAITANPSDLPEGVAQYTSNTTYINPDQVDEVATVLDVPELPQPTTPIADLGKAVLIIYVGVDGTPEFVEVEQSTLPMDYTDLLTLHFQMASFKPAMLFGSPVSSWRRIEVTFEGVDSLDHTETKDSAR